MLFVTTGSKMCFIDSNGSTLPKLTVSPALTPFSPTSPTMFPPTTLSIWIRFAPL